MLVNFYVLVRSNPPEIEKVSENSLFMFPHIQKILRTLSMQSSISELRKDSICCNLLNLWLLEGEVERSRIKKTIGCGMDVSACSTKVGFKTKCVAQWNMMFTCVSSWPMNREFLSCWQAPAASAMPLWSHGSCSGCVTCIAARLDLVISNPFLTCGHILASTNYWSY